MYVNGYSCWLIGAFFDSPEVAQFLNLSIPECRAIVERYYEEEERELFKIREKWVNFMLWTFRKWPKLIISYSNQI